MSTDLHAGRASGERTLRALRAEELVQECLRRRAAGEHLPDEQIIAAHPELMPELQEELQRLRIVQAAKDRADAGETLASLSSLPHESGAEATADGSVTIATLDSIHLESLVERSCSRKAADEPPSIAGYQIIREIHRGGQGVVYEAVQLSTQRTVAVKVLLEGPFISERARWRFEREVRLIAALRHPNIIVIHDSGITHGRYYFAMDYVRGQPLDTHVRLTRPAVRPLIQMFRQICDAVAYAHGRGVIHRDLKPSNILVGENGVPCVLDFGLAKIVSEELQESQQGLVSIAGGLIGTIRYMAPEQTLGNPDAIDVRTDIYALGVVLYELLTGTPPYATSGDLAVALKNIQEAEPPRPSRLRHEINADLEIIILKALAKEPDRRYETASKLADDLDAWLDGRPISARSASSLYVVRKLAVRHGYESLLLLALILTIGSVGTLGFQALQKARRAEASREETSRALAEARLDLNAFHQQAWTYLRGVDLGWFFMAYRAGQTALATELRDARSPGSPERLVMDFLLDPEASDESIRQALGARASGLAEFAIGQRHLHSSRLDAAREAFERAASRAQEEPTIATAAAAELSMLQGTMPSGDKPE